MVMVRLRSQKVSTSCLGQPAHLHAHVLEKHDVVTVGIHMGVSDDIGLGMIAHLLDFHHIVDLLCARRDRAPALQTTGNPTDRLIADVFLLAHPTHAQQQYPQGMGAAFIHQGAGHDHVVHKVACQEPVIRGDISLGLYQTLAESSSPGLQCNNAMDQPHPAAGQTHGLRQPDLFESIAEAGVRISLSQGVNPGVVIGFVSQRHTAAGRGSR